MESIELSQNPSRRQLPTETVYKDQKPFGTSFRNSLSNRIESELSWYYYYVGKHVDFPRGTYCTYKQSCQCIDEW